MTDLTNPNNDTETFRVFGREIDPEDYLYIAATENIAFHFGQSAEDIVLARLFHNMTGGFYVDVGAFHPTKYSNTFLLHRFFGWRGVNIDASKDAIDLFEKERPKDINIQTGIGLEEGELVLYKFDHPARNTLSEENVKRQVDKGDANIVGEEKVKVKRLAEVLKEHLPEGQGIDLMNIDIEGFDMQALESNDWKLFRPKVVLIEDYSLGQSGVANSPVYKFLTQRGYKFHSHTFDTSIYVEKTFKPPEKTQNFRKYLRNAYLNDMDTAYRTSILTDPHGKGTREQKLNAKIEQNKLSREKLESLEKSCNELREKIDEAKNEENKYAEEYRNIVTSRAWLHMEKARKISGKIRNSTGRKKIE